MQKPDAVKRERILRVAARLFAHRPYHGVTLGDVAAGARVGKGTLYVYFRSKEALFGAILDEAFVRVVDDIEASLIGASGGAWERLEIVVRGLVKFGGAYPAMFRLMRAGVDVSGPIKRRARTRLLDLVERVVGEGVRAGELREQRADLAAGCIVSCVRGAMLFGPEGLPEREIVGHVLGMLRSGVVRGSGAAPPRRKP
ncbi:MAG: TetR/AcrR family transcriptional regulator [Phycisphaerales bacterium]|nr:TetR/AcrR family transcriptional regulator [Phycisphaerales bacterium]